MKGLPPLAAVFVVAMWATAAYADGGWMLLHQDAGAFTVTLFAAPQPLRVGTADLSVMVQDRSSGQVLLDSSVDLTLAAEAPNAKQQRVRLAGVKGGDRLLQGAPVLFSNAGKWRLVLLVQHGNDVAHLSTECSVEPDRSRARLVWFYVLLPLGIILLFAVHQGLKLRSEVKAR